MGRVYEIRNSTPESDTLMRKMQELCASSDRSPEIIALFEKVEERWCQIWWHEIEEENAGTCVKRSDLDIPSAKQDYESWIDRVGSDTTPLE